MYDKEIRLAMALNSYGDAFNKYSDCICAALDIVLITYMH